MGYSTKIIVIYDRLKGKNIKGQVTEHFTPFYFDQSENKQDVLLQKIIANIKDTEIKTTNNGNALAAIFGIGLGLLILGTLANNKK